MSASPPPITATVAASGPKPAKPNVADHPAAKRRGAQPADAGARDVQPHHRSAHVLRHVGQRRHQRRSRDGIEEDVDEPQRHRCRTGLLPSEQRDGGHSRCEHRGGEDRPTIWQPVGKLAAQYRAEDVAHCEHRQRQRHCVQLQAVGRLQECREVHRDEPVTNPLGDAHGEQLQDRPGKRSRASTALFAADAVPVSTRAAVVAIRPIALAAASAATQRLTPRQPIWNRPRRATGTPISSVSDWPLMTQPKARPCWPAETRAETSVNITPVNIPLHPPPSVAQATTPRNVSAVGDAESHSKREWAADQERSSSPSVGPGAGKHRREPPGDRGDGDQIGDKRHAREDRAPCPSGTAPVWCRWPAAVNIASDAAASNAQGSRPGRDKRAATRSGALIGRSVVMQCLYISDSDH